MSNAEENPEPFSDTL